MSRLLPRALALLAKAPVCDDRERWASPGWLELQLYLDGISLWQRFGREIAAPERRQIADLWRHRPDLRPVLSEAVGGYVCGELVRPFLRGGAQGDIPRWLGLFPDLQPHIRAIYLAKTRRFNHAYDVVLACAVLYRHLGEGSDIWRAAALALRRHLRREAKMTHIPPWNKGFLRHDLETHGTITPSEGDLINRHLDPSEGETLDVMNGGAWWHPRPLPDEEVLQHLTAVDDAFARIA